MSIYRDDASPCSDKGSAGGSTVWCSGKKYSVVNGINVYYPLVSSSEEVGRLLIEMCIILC